MYSHIMVGANDIDASKTFYDAILGALGYEPGFFDDKGRVFYMDKSGIFSITKPIDGQPAGHGNGNTIGFAAKDPAQADAWHAAGLVGQLRASASITKVLEYSVDLYKGLAAETGLDTGWKMTGCLRLATTPDRWTEFRRLATTARSFGMEMDLISPDEVKRMWPLMDTSDLIGASWLPTDGQASPSDITQSLAKGARMHGAKIVEGVRVTGFRMDGRRITHVETTEGDIACETVVNCGGMWARQIGAMAGVAVPLHPVKHQYIVTEKIPGLSSGAATLRGRPACSVKPSICCSACRSGSPCCASPRR